jgi:small subunit ribosomal protein S5
MKKGEKLPQEGDIEDKVERKEENLEEEIIESKDPIKKEEEILSENKEEVSEEKEVAEEKPQETRRGRYRKFQEKDVLGEWEPKTKLGIDVQNKKIKNIDDILDAGKKILEGEIVDTLIKVKSDLISIGQSKGKFGGGKRRAWRQTQRKTKEGNVPSFSTMAVVGDENGHVGVGSGKAKETLPARDKAIRKAKINIIKIERTCASFDCSCSKLHTVPFKVEGKTGSVKVVLIPAPQGTGLVVARELKKVLSLAGIKDVYSKTFGRKRTTFNLIKACIEALKQTTVRREEK